MPLTRLNLALHRTYKPQNGAPFLADLSEHVRVRPETIAGVDELVPEHRAWLVAALSGLAVGPTPIRATPPTKAELEAEANVLAVATVTLTLKQKYTIVRETPLRCQHKRERERKQQKTRKLQKVAKKWPDTP